MATSPGSCSLHNAVVVVVVCYIIDKCTAQPLHPKCVVCWAREIREDSITKQTKNEIKCTWCVTCLIYFPRVARCKGRYGGFGIEVVRGFLYPKYIVRTSSGCIRIGTCSFKLWCDERKTCKFESKKYVHVWNDNLFLKGSSENEQMRVCLTGKIRGLSLLYQREKQFWS